MRLITDSFDRSNGAIGSNWSNDAGSFVIDTNLAECDSLNGSGLAYTSLVATLDSPNMTVSADVVCNAISSVGIAARYTNPDNTYIVYISTSSQEVVLAKLVGGSYTEIGDYAGGYANGNSYNIRFELSGTNLRVYVNGTLRINETDSAIATGGAVAMFSDATGNTINNFYAGNISHAVPTTFATSVTSMPVNLPPAIVAGELLIAHVGVRNPGTWTVPSGWVLLEEKIGGGSVGETGVWYKVADGTEGATATWTAGTATTAAWQVRKITNWHGTTPPEHTSANGDFTTAPNPPSLSPSWGADDTLWLALAGSSATAMNFTAAPTNYTGLASTVASTGGGASNAGSAIREANTGTEDPGLFTTSQNRWWATFTVAVAPAGGTPPPSGSLVKVYTGAAFEEKPVKVYTGAAFEEKPLKVYNGSSWDEI